MSNSKNDTLFDKYLNRVKNNKVLASITVLGVIIIASATFATSLKTLIEPLRSTSSSNKNTDDLSMLMDTLLTTGQVNQVIINGQKYKITIEVLQEDAVTTARGTISHVLNFRPDDVTYFSIKKTGGKIEEVHVKDKDGGASSFPNFLADDAKELASLKTEEIASLQDAKNYLLANVIVRLE